MPDDAHRDGRRPGRFTQILALGLGPWFALAAMLLTAALLGALFVFSMEPLNPVYASRLISVAPADGVVDRDAEDRFTLKREVCSRRAMQVQVLRAWTEIVDGEEVRPTTAWSSLYFDLKAGCHEVHVSQGVPMSLAPARYVYEVSLRSCGPFGWCSDYGLEAVPLALVNGRGWPKVHVPPPPPPHELGGSLKGGPVRRMMGSL